MFFGFFEIQVFQNRDLKPKTVTLNPKTAT